jgi:hypothetical protein
MITAENLTKTYGAKTAVDGISFTVLPGRLVRGAADLGGTPVAAHLPVGDQYVHPFPRVLQWKPLSVIGDLAGTEPAPGGRLLRRGARFREYCRETGARGLRQPGANKVNEAIGLGAVPVVVFPRVNAAHARHPAWDSHIAALRRAGVRSARPARWATSARSRS